MSREGGAPHGRLRPRLAPSERGVLEVFVSWVYTCVMNLTGRSFNLSGSKWFPGFLLYIAAGFIVILGLHAMASLLTTILAIAFLLILLSMVYEVLVKWKMPPKLSVGIIITVFILVALFFTLLILPATITELSRNIPVYYKQLIAAAKNLTAFLQDQEINMPDDFFTRMLHVNTDEVAAFSKNLLFKLPSALADSFMILVLLSFALMEFPFLPRHLVHWHRLYPEQVTFCVRFVRDVRRFIGIKTFISALTGIFIYFGLIALQVKSALLLSLLAFLLNFVPYIGSVIAAAVGFLLALSSGTLATGLWTLVLYFVVNQVLGNIIEPRALGKGFGVSPVLVLFSVIFWGWILGPLGMLFAVPFTVAIRSAFFFGAERSIADSKRSESGVPTAKSEVPTV